MRSRAIARILGNFGIAFFSPLIGIDVGKSLYGIGMPLEQTLIISLIAASFTSGLAISKEAVEYGRIRKG